MARGRMISKSLSTSEKYAALYACAGKLAEFAQALFPLLVAHADDSGREQGDVFTVKHAVFPISRRAMKDFESALTSLDVVGLIRRYEVDGRFFIQIEQFSNHQPGLKNRGNSKIPEMPQDAVKCREMPSEGKRREEKRTEENRTEGKGTEGNGADAPSPLRVVSDADDPSTPDCKIDALVLKWNQTVMAPIPQCRGLSDARKAHTRARLKDNLLSDLMAAIDRVQASDFCHGKNDRGWVPDFGWLMQSQDNVFKVLEGKYDNRPNGRAATGTDGRGRTGAPRAGKYDGIEVKD